MLKSERRKLVAKADKIFSEYIRARDGYQCFICGKIGGVMQCGHLITRADYSVRWFELNGNCSCPGCNMRHEYDYSIYHNKFIAIKGNEAWEEIRLKRLDKHRYTNWEIECIAKHYKNKLNELQKNKL
jgi:hypothetical protein